MNPKQEPSSSTGRHRLLALFTVILSLSVALYAAEWILGYQRHQIESSDRLDPGMVLFDPTTGWRLAPGWKGSHRHHDFNATYAINADGFRGAPPLPRSGLRHRYLVLGDSFAFGQGVDDGQVFVPLLEDMSEGSEFLNLSVPGFSTDQEYLLLKQRLEELRPDVVLLMVYLGNDLFDNQRPFPLQGEHAKPYFELESGGRLTLRNYPVRIQRKPADARGRSLFSVVLGEDARPPQPALLGWLGQLEISRRLGLFQPEPVISEQEFKQRFRYTLMLFKALVGGIQDLLSQQDVLLKIVLLPGRSFVERPGSLSFRYQDFLRRGILDDVGAAGGIEVIDLAARLGALDPQESGGLYFPNEGHFTPAGHRLLADMLADRLALKRDDERRSP